MHPLLASSIHATLTVGVIGVVLFLITLVFAPVSMLIYLVFMMLPLWLIDSLGINVGTVSNGFFLPNEFGWFAIAFIYGLIFFLIYYLVSFKE